MSKIYNKYLELKKSQKEETLYLFKAGIFYIFIEKDAEKISTLLNLKLTNLNDNIKKCGFPSNNLVKYLNLLTEHKIHFKIIDQNLSIIDSHTKYIENEAIKKHICKIKNISLDDITPKQAYDILYDLQKDIKEVEVK